MKLLNTDEGQIDLENIESGKIVNINNIAYKIYNYNGDIRKYKIRENGKGRPKQENYTINTDEGRIPLNEINSGYIYHFNNVEIKVYITHTGGKLRYVKVPVKEPQKRGPKKKNFFTI